MKFSKIEADSIFKSFLCIIFTADISVFLVGIFDVLKYGLSIQDFNVIFHASILIGLSIIIALLSSIVGITAYFMTGFIRRKHEVTY